MPDAVWVNGGIVLSPGADVAGAGGTLNGVDVLKMKRVLRREKEWIRALEALGLSRQEAVKVVSDSGGGAGEEGKAKTSQVSKEIMDGRVDASDRQEGGDVILWWNDIEKDARYARWGTSFYSVSLHLRFASRLTRILAAHASNLSRPIPLNQAKLVQYRADPRPFESNIASYSWWDSIGHYRSWDPIPLWSCSFYHIR